MTTSAEKVDVYMPFYVADYLADTTDLSAEEHGVYFLLLLNLWKRDGRLPCEPTRLARMVGLSIPEWERVWLAIGRFFELEDGHFCQSRLSRELTKAKALRAAASDNGRKGAGVRWGSHSPANGVAIVSPMATPIANHIAKNSSSPSESPSESESEPTSPSPSKGKPRSRAPASALVPHVPNAFDRLLGVFCASWEQRYREPYMVTPGDRGQFGRILSGLPAEISAMLPACFENYLQDEEPFVAQKMRHSLMHFCTSGGINKYRVETAVFSDREAKGIAAGRQWLGFHEGKSNAGQR